MNAKSCLRLSRISLVPFLFCFVLPGFAQIDDIQFQRLTAEEVLSANRMIFYIEQDVNGFMWFDDVKYDGRTARRYTNFSVLTLKTSKLFEENWAQGKDSIHYYDLKRDSFINNLPERMLSYHILCVDCFVQDTAKNIWLLTVDKGVLIDGPSSKSFRKLSHQEEIAGSLSSDRVSWILRDSLNQIWISTRDAGLNLWQEGDKFQHFRLEPDNPASLSSDTIYRLQQDQGGIIWIGTSQGLCRLDPTTKTVSRINLPALRSKKVNHIFVHSSGKLWLGLDMSSQGPILDQVVIYDPIANQVEATFEDLNIYHGYPIVEDHLGRVWLGSEGQGIYIYDPRSKHLAHYQRNSRDPNSLSSGKIREIYRDRHNRIWIGTFNGVNIYDPNARVFHHLESDTKQEHFFNSEQKINGLEDPQGNIWFTSRGAGLIRFDPISKEIKVYKIEGASANDFLKIESDDRGNIWTTTAIGEMYILNPDTEEFTLLPAKANGGLAKDSQGRIWAAGREGLFLFTDPKSPPVLYDWDIWRGTELQLGPTDSHFWVTEMLIDCNDMIWLSGNLLLFRFNPADQSIRQFQKHPELGHFLGLSLDRNCGLWMGSVMGRGLFYLPQEEQSKAKPQFKRWHTQNSALPNPFLRDVVEDQEGKLWFGSAAGITRFDPKAQTFLTYGQKQGFKTKGNSAVRAKDGTIYVGGINGIGYFHPDRLPENNFPPPTYLTDIRINGYSLTHNDSLPFPSPLHESVAYAKSIELKHWQNELIFEFVALNYTSPQNNQYEYQLIGYDQERKTTDASDPKANYTNLSPGSYTFKLIGKNNDGYESEEALTLDIYIAPPWWRTWWAYVLYALAAFGLIWMIIRNELRKQAKKIAIETEARQSREMAALKTRFYTNITHEFRTPLTVILGMARQIVENPSGWLQEGSQMIIRNGEQLLKLINQMLDLSKLDEGHLSVQLVQDDLIKHLKYLTKSFSSYADTKNIRLHFLTQITAINMDFDPEKMQTIISNLVGNAIKFTPEGGDVYVSVDRAQNAQEDDLLEIRVKDNGIGIPAKQLPYIFDRFFQAETPQPEEEEIVRPLRTGGTGIGLALTKELVKLMGGSISVSSKEKEGTEFSIRLPIRQEAAAGKAEELAPLVATKPALPVESLKNIIDEKSAGNDRPLALLIEDNPDVVHYLKSLLAKQYELEIASNGIEGIEKAIQLIPDIIISDVMMPGKDGFEVVNILKEDERTGHIPMILLTAKADLESRLQGLEHGADAYLSKPFNRKELEVRLRTLLEFRKKLQAFAEEETRQAVIPTYMGLVHQIDDHLGRVFDLLKRAGRMEDTLIVFTADHGDHLGDHWLADKGMFYEQATRVPLIIYDPSPSADNMRGSTSDALVEGIDLFPTFLEAVDAEIPEHRLEGESLIPILSGHKTSTHRKAAICEMDYAFIETREGLDLPVDRAMGRMVRTADWKYVHFDTLRPQLFDLNADPDELNDLGVDPDYADVRNEMKALLLDWSLDRKMRITVDNERVVSWLPAGKKKGISKAAW